LRAIVRKNKADVRTSSSLRNFRARSGGGPTMTKEQIEAVCSEAKAVGCALSCTPLATQARAMPCWPDARRLSTALFSKTKR